MSTTGLLQHVQKVVVASLAFAMAFASQAASERKWIGPTSGGAWSQPKNWYPEGTPGATDILVFNTAVTDVEDDIPNLAVAAIIHRHDTALTIRGASTLKITGDSNIGIDNNAQADMTMDVPVNVNAVVYCYGASSGSTYKLIFKKGVTSLQFKVGKRGRVCVRDVPMTLGTAILFQEQGQSYCDLEVAGNTGDYRGYNNAFLTLGAEDAWSGSVQLGTAAGGPATLDLGGWDQHGITKLTTHLSLSVYPTITSATPASIFLSGATQNNPTVVNARLTGAAGLCWNPDDPESILTFADIVQTTTGELGVLNGTMRLSDGASFSQLSELTVGETGTFKIESGSGNGFSADEVDLAEGGVLDLGEGVNVKCKRFKVGESEYLEGGMSYCGGEGPAGMTRVPWILGKGTVTVVLSPDPTSEAVWDAGGVDNTSLGLAANWVGDVVPDLTSGGLAAEFGAGTVATIDQTARFNGIQVTSDSGDFTFAKSGDARMKLYSGGVALSAGTAGRSLTFEAPVEIGQDQSWTVSGANDKISVNGGLFGAGTVTIGGSGTVRLSGASGLTGGIVLSIPQDKIFTIDNVDIAGPFSLKQNALQNMQDSGSESRSIFRGMYDMSGTLYKWLCNGEVIFAGGVQATGNMQMLFVEGKGTYIVTNAPYVAINNKKQTVYLDTGATLELLAADNWLAPLVYNDSHLKCRTASALNGRYGLTLGQDTGFDNQGWVDISGDQSIMDFVTYNTTKQGQEVRSDSHSVLTVADTVDRDNFATFVGGASLRHAGIHTTTLHKISTTTGSVEVVAGTLVFAAASTTAHTGRSIVNPGAIWINATKVVVGGGDSSAVLKLAHRGTFGKQVAVEMRDNGKIEIAEGVSEKVASLSVNGTPLSPGVYGATGSGASEVRDDLFSGKGLLKVGKLGMVMVVR